jgi:hypothetical protein
VAGVAGAMVAGSGFVYSATKTVANWDAEGEAAEAIQLKPGNTHLLESTFVGFERI